MLHLRSLHRRLRKFDEFYQKGYIDSVVTTNLNYRSPELFTKEWYVEADMSKYMLPLSTP